jgi:hypothetical protein
MRDTVTTNVWCFTQSMLQHLQAALHTDFYTKVWFLLAKFSHFFANFVIKKGGAEIMRGIFETRCFRGDYQVRSRNR